MQKHLSHFGPISHCLNRAAKTTTGYFLSMEQSLNAQLASRPNCSPAEVVPVAAVHGVGDRWSSVGEHRGFGDDRQLHGTPTACPGAPLDVRVRLYKGLPPHRSGEKRIARRKGPKSRRNAGSRTVRLPHYVISNFATSPRFLSLFRYTDSHKSSTIWKLIWTGLA